MWFGGRQLRAPGGGFPLLEGTAPSLVATVFYGSTVDAVGMSGERLQYCTVRKACLSA